MAGFQQAANALTGAVGTVANRVGLYSELVGKNQQYRAQLEEQNAALAKANEVQEALTEKNRKQAESLENILKAKNAQHNLSSKKSAKRKKRKEELIERTMSQEQAHMSKALALSLLYGDFASGSGGI